MKIMKKTLIFILFSIIPHIAISQYNKDSVIFHFKNILNDYRESNELNSLIINNSLKDFTENHVESMLINQKIFHSGNDGKSFMIKITTNFVGVKHSCENVAKLSMIDKNEYSDYELAYSVFTTWRESDGHNKNLLKKNITSFYLAFSNDKTMYYFEFLGIGY